jgi:hypothetical protein
LAGGIGWHMSAHSWPIHAVSLILVRSSTLIIVANDLTY